MSNSSITILDDKIAMVAINIGTFGGYRRATRQQIAALGGNLPNCKAVTEGSIKVFKGEALSPFHTSRRNIFRKMAKRGIKALDSGNVFAIPIDQLSQSENEIEDAEAAFGVLRASLDTNYDQIFEDHVAETRAEMAKQGATVAEMDEAESILRSRKFSRQEAIGKLTFSSSLFKISAIVRDGEDHEQGVAAIVAGLARQLFEEVASEMAKLSENEGFTAKGRVGQKTLRPLKAAVGKMQGLSFLDPAVDGAIKLAVDTLATLPREGYIEGSAFVTLRRLVELMSDTDDLLNAASRVRNGIPADVVVNPPAPAVQQQPVVQPAPPRQAAMPAATVVSAAAATRTALPVLPLMLVPPTAVPPPPARRPNLVPMF
jgi:hypothetical protein